MLFEPNNSLLPAQGLLPNPTWQFWCRKLDCHMSRQIAPSLFDIMNQLRLEVWMTPNGLHNTHLAKFAVSLPVFPSSLLLETQPTRPKFSIMFSLLCLSLICSIIVATTISGFSLDLNLHIISIVH